MKATLTLTFEDGSTRELELQHAVEIGVGPQAKESISFHQKASGEWIMAFTKPTFQGKKISTVKMEKQV